MMSRIYLLMLIAALLFLVSPVFASENESEVDSEVDSEAEAEMEAEVDAEAELELFHESNSLLDQHIWVHEPSTKITEMRLASIKQSPNVGLATTKTSASYATLDLATTWAEANEYCGRMGYRLCEAKEICPKGEENPPNGADELPEKAVFTPIRGTKTNPENVYLALTASAGDGICTKKINPDFGTQAKEPASGTTKSLVACCATDLLITRGVSAGMIQTVRASNEAANKFHQRRAERIERERIEAEKKAAEERERIRKQKEEEERRKKERELDWDQSCIHSGVRVEGKRAYANQWGYWRGIRSKQVYREGTVKVAVKIHSNPHRHMMIGFVGADQSCGSHSFVHHIYHSGRAWYMHGSNSQLYPQGWGYGGRYWEQGDTVGAVLNFSDRTINFYKNGYDQGKAYSNVDGGQYFAVSFLYSGSVEIVDFPENK